MKTRKTIPTMNRANWSDVLFFFGPLLAFYLVYYFFSTGFLIVTSFQKVTLAFKNPKWLGWKNYELLLTDDKFITALTNNFIFAAAAIMAGLTLGFFIAVALSSGVRGKSYYYAVFLLPTLMPLALVASVFRIMLESRYGAVNGFLRGVGLEELAMNWLIDPNLAFGVVIVLFVYLIGLPILYYTANLSTVNTSLLEAAVLDGAKTGRLMWEILYPLMKGTHRTIILSVLLTSFRAFDIVFFSTGGGPAGRTEIAGTYVYNFSTSGSNLGYASSAAIVVIAVCLVVSVLQIIIERRFS